MVCADRLTPQSVRIAIRFKTDILVVPYHTQAQGRCILTICGRERWFPISRHGGQPVEDADAEMQGAGSLGWETPYASF